MRAVRCAAGTWSEGCQTYKPIPPIRNMVAIETLRYLMGTTSAVSWERSGVSSATAEVVASCMVAGRRAPFRREAKGR